MRKKIKRILEKLFWQPIHTAPKNGPILVMHKHSEPAMWEEPIAGKLSRYGSALEGLGPILPDGPHVAEYGGGYFDEGWPGGFRDVYVSDWWYQFGSEFERPLNPKKWKRI